MDAKAWLANERRDIDNAQAALRAAQSRGGGVVRLDWTSPAQRMAAVADAFRAELTLAEYGKQWIDQRDLKPRTKTHYTAIFETHISPKLGSINVSALRPAAVRSWYAATLKDKPTMRAHAYQLLHAICGTAVSDELLDRNPCQIEGATVVKRSREPVVPEIGELATIADTIEAKWRAFVPFRHGAACDSVKPSSCGAKTSAPEPKSFRCRAAQHIAQPNRLVPMASVV